MKRKEVSIYRKLNYLNLAIHDFVTNPSYTLRTDVVGIACQYSSNPKLKREDFEELLEMDLKSICALAQKKYKDEKKNKQRI